MLCSTLFLCLHQAGSGLVTDLIKFIHAVGPVVQLSFRTAVLAANNSTINSPALEKLPS